MEVTYFIPDWFFSFSVGMELLFALITLAVAVAGAKIYFISKEKDIWRFSVGFFMISISYAAWAALNAHIAADLNKGEYLFSLINPPLMHIIGAYVYMIFFIAGLVTLAFATFKSEKDKDSIYYVLLGLALTAVVASYSKFVTLRIVSLFLITFLAYHYFTEWYSNRNRKTYMIFIAFILLTLSNIFFIFIISSEFTYVAGHVLELGAYSLIFYTLVRTLLRK